ncbi:hypothetical protein SprV_0200781300 [Sparganum proliferum]
MQRCTSAYAVASENIFLKYESKSMKTMVNNRTLSMKSKISFLILLLFISEVAKATQNILEDESLKSRRPAFRYEALEKRYPYWRSYIDDIDFSGPEAEVQSKTVPGYSAPSRKRGAYFDMPWG